MIGGRDVTRKPRPRSATSPSFSSNIRSTRITFGVRQYGLSRCVRRRVNGRKQRSKSGFTKSPRCCASRLSSTTARPSSPAARCSGCRSAAPWCALPERLLMDEPLSSLDAKLREELRRRAEAHPARTRRDHRLRHPRSDRGHDAGRPDRRAGGGPFRAGRHAARNLRDAGQHLCRPTARLTAHQSCPSGASRHRSNARRRFACRRAAGRCRAAPGRRASRPRFWLWSIWGSRRLSLDEHLGDHAGSCASRYAPAPVVSGRPVRPGDRRPRSWRRHVVLRQGDGDRVHGTALERNAERHVG